MGGIIFGKGFGEIFPTIQSEWIDTGLARWTDNTHTNVKFIPSAMTADVVLPYISDGWRLTSCYGMFSYCSGITNDRGQLDNLSNIDLSNVTDTRLMFAHCINLIIAPIFNIPNLSNPNGMFQYCDLLIEIKELDISKVSLSPIELCASGFSLEKCYIRNIKVSLNFMDCANLERDSIILMFNELEPSTNNYYFRLDNTAYARLTLEDIKIATDKGWSVIM